MDLVRNTRTAPRRVAPLHFNDRANEVAFRPLRAGLVAPLCGKQQPILPLDECAMKLQQTRGLDGNRRTDQTGWRDEERTESSNQPIGKAQIRCAASGAIENEQLLFQ